MCKSGKAKQAKTQLRFKMAYSVTSQFQFINIFVVKLPNAMLIVCTIVLNLIH